MSQELKKLINETRQKLEEIRKHNPPGPFREAALAAATKRHNQKALDIKRRQEKRLVKA